MKEKPILFSGPMVRAILDGRKTQTRRVVKTNLRSESDGSKRRVLSLPRDLDVLNCYLSLRQANPLHRFCPYGQPGDRLWVKETFRFDGIDHRFGMAERRKDDLSFRADMEADRSVNDCPWRPSIFMPRWASRITLEITGVRVERLQEISDRDCLAEGVERRQEEDTPFRAYRDLWESINGPGSWDANPWVWCISFRRVEK